MEIEGIKHVRNHCKCPYCGERIQIVIHEDGPHGHLQVWTRKRK